MLEGPFNSDQMSNHLYSQELLPLNQPYNTSPWNYSGNENMSVLPADVIDWVLVEILEETTGGSSPFFLVNKRKAGLLLNNGKITDINGLSLLMIESMLPEFYIRVLHRNHLPLTSSTFLTNNSGVYSYDFTTSPDKALDGLNTMNEVNTDVWAMKAADGNANFQIDNIDKIEIWLPQHTNNGYLAADYNMDGKVDLSDITNIWTANTGSGTNDYRSSQILKVCSENGRYFCKGDEAVFLTGSHTWDNFQDIGNTFNYEDYIDWLVSLNHNFIRLWVWETPKGTNWAKDIDHDISPDAYKKIGDNYDVNQLNEGFFERMVNRIQLAADNDIYISIMLFQGFSAEHDPIAWAYHPLKGGNNVNGISAEPLDVHSNLNMDALQAQQLFVRRVIDLVNSNGFDNVLYEIGNEIEYSEASDIWHNDMIDYIHDYELSTYGVNRPVGKTYQYENGSNEQLFNSPADWISPNPVGGFDCRDGDAPIANGDKVIISDTDHLFYQYYTSNGHPEDMVWKSFSGGINVCHMDNWGGGSNLPGRLHGWPISTSYTVIRNNMGYARLLAETLDLVAMIPQPEISTTGFCIASELEYVVYLSETVSEATLDLSASNGSFSVQWLNCADGNFTSGSDITASNNITLISPFSEHSVLILRKILK